MFTSPARRIAAIGELLWDLIPSGPRLGGTITNFGVMSARLGADVTLISRTGDDDFGRQARAQLSHSVGSLSLSSLQHSPSLPTGTVSVTLRPDGQPSYRIDQPVAWDEIDFPPTLAALTPSFDLVCFGSLAQRLPTSRQAIRALVEATAPACIRVCDINLRMPFCTPETTRWCLAHSTLLKISDEELPEVARMLQIDFDPAPEAASLASQIAFARTLLARAPQCRLIAITLGARGSLLVDAASFHREPGRSVQVVDTIGAGDAFTAGMVYAFLRGASLSQVSAVGNLCGSFVASQPGATPELPPSLFADIRAALGDSKLPVGV